MLESRFPRIPGDIGNPVTWPFPVRYRIVTGASPDRVVRGGAAGLLETFIEAGRELAADGVAGITTSCGFLASMQQALADAIPVPVAASSLVQIGMIERLLPPGRRCGILTIAVSCLSATHLDAARVAADTPIGSTEGGAEFTRAILDDEAQLDVALARQDNIEAALDLQARHPEVAAIVLECTNMAPYAADIASATGLPVYSVDTFVRWFQAGLRPRRFD